MIVCNDVMYKDEVQRIDDEIKHSQIDNAAGDVHYILKQLYRTQRKYVQSRQSCYLWTPLIGKSKQ